MKRPCVPELSVLLAFAIGLFAGCSSDDGSTQLFDYGSCPALIECAADLAPEARDEYEQVYGAGGSCWANVSSWSACRDFCRTTLEGLNLVAMTTGDTCGTCSSDADCSSFGAGARCENGLCAGGSGSTADGETGEESDPETDTNTDADTDADTDPDTDADTDTNEDTNDTADDSADCQPVPQECQDLLDCLAIVLPDVDVSQFEAGGACWCGTTAEANECVDVCTDQFEAAGQSYPDVPECKVNPCPGGEGCFCRDATYCKGNLLCDDFFNECYVPEFGECYGDDPLCPATGCPNGYAYFDKDDDGQPDFASCKVPCDEELGLGECTDVALHPHYTGDPECIWGGYFNWNNGLICVGVCDFDSDCPDGSVCVGSRCWYDVP